MTAIAHPRRENHDAATVRSFTACRAERADNVWWSWSEVRVLVPFLAGGCTRLDHGPLTRDPLAYISCMGFQLWGGVPLPARCRWPDR